MSKPLGQQSPVVSRHTAVGIHPLEAIGPRCAADPIPLLVQAQSRIDHVLARQVRRPGDGEEVLGEPALRAAKRADLARAPVASGQPFAGVVPVLQFAPGQGAVTDPRAFGFLGAAEVDMQHTKTLGRQTGGHLACASPLQTGVTLFEDPRPRALAGGQIEITGKPLAVSHRHHHVRFGDVAEVEVVGGRCGRRAQQRGDESREQDFGCGRLHHDGSRF